MIVVCVCCIFDARFLYLKKKRTLITVTHYLHGPRYWSFFILRWFKHQIFSRLAGKNVSTLLPSVQSRFFGTKLKYVISKPYTLTYNQSSHALPKPWISTKQLGPAPIAFFMVLTTICFLAH